MKRGLLLLCCLSSICFGQVEGPWTIWEGEGLADSLMMRVMASSDSTADIVYQVGMQTWWQRFDIVHGRTLGWPSVISEADSGYVRTIQDGILFDDTCVILLYDQSSRYNLTILLRKSGEDVTEFRLDSANNYPQGFWGSSRNENLRLAATESNMVMMTWVDYWTHYGWFWEAGIAFVIRAVDVRNGNMLWYDDGLMVSFSDGWIIAAQTDTPIIVGVDAYSSLCLGDIVNGWWSPCGSWNGWEVNCACLPMAMWADSAQRVRLLSAGRNAFRPAMLVVDTAHWGCDLLYELDSNPLAAAVNEVVGVAWVTAFPGGLDLTRASIDGVILHEAGAINWTEAGYRVAAEDLVISGGGRVMVLWSEERVHDPAHSRLRIAAVSWDTPLSAPDSRGTPLPSSLSLSAYPNPFNGELRVRYELARGQELTLKVFDVMGREVATLVEAKQSAGAHEVSWTATVASGIYFVRLLGETGNVSEKVLLMK